MPDRDRNTVTQRVTLGDGQINLNGTVLDVNGITFTQDGVEAARIDGDTLFRLDNDAGFTATATVSDYDAFEDMMRRLDTSTYSNSSPKPIPRAMVVIFILLNLFRQFIK